MDVLKEIKQYCELNNIDNVDDVVNKCLIQGFNILKYGYFPNNKIKKHEESTRKNERECETKVPTESRETDKEEEIKPVKEETKSLTTSKPRKRKIKIIKTNS